MLARRKLKKLFLFIFLSALLIKIHCDYQALISVDKNHISQTHFLVNTSIPSKLASFNSIRDIIASTDNLEGHFFYQKKGETDIGNKEFKGVFSPGIAGSTFKPSDLDDKKEDGQNQMDSPIQSDTGESVGASRVHSFKGKMEEVLHQKMQSVKASEPTVQQEAGEPNFKGGKVELIAPTKSDSSKHQEEAQPSVNHQNVIQTNRIIPFKRKPIFPSRFIYPNLMMNSSEANKRLQILKKQLSISKKPVKKAQTSHKVSHLVDIAEISLNASEIQRIKTDINAINEQQLIRNMEVFGPILNNNTVIVIQVSNATFLFFFYCLF